MIKNLFFIRNEQEYAIAMNYAQSNAICEYNMLTINDKFPYLSNHCCHLEKVSTWQDWGIIEFGFSRYWQNNYQEIDHINTCDTSDYIQYNSQIVQSQFFKFGLNWLMGSRYYDTINSLDIFFLEHKPKVIFLNPKDTFIFYLMDCFAKAYNFKCIELP